MFMKRRILLAAPLLAALPLAFPTARAAASDAASTPEAAPVTALDDALIATMKAGSAGASFMARYTALKPVVERSFDLPNILQTSAGLLWPQIPPAQQAELLTLFTQYTVASYISSFSGYGGQHFDTLPGTRRVGAKRVVTTDLVAPGGHKTELAYVMAPTAGSWKITDVLFEGTISKVATQRSDFGSLIEPGNANKLIAALKQKVTALSGGALKG
jgi:phospholipid transport system substrate-binding protein